VEIGAALLLGMAYQVLNRNQKPHALQGLAMRQSRARGWTGRPPVWGDPPVGAKGIGQATFHLPVGTVRFMLTDLEGSTRL